MDFLGLNYRISTWENISLTRYVEELSEKWEQITHLPLDFYVEPRFGRNWYVSRILIVHGPLRLKNFSVQRRHNSVISCYLDTGSLMDKVTQLLGILSLVLRDK